MFVIEFFFIFAGGWQYNRKGESSLLQFCHRLQSEGKVLVPCRFAPYGVPSKGSNQTVWLLTMFYCLKKIWQISNDSYVNLNMTKSPFGNYDVNVENSAKALKSCYMFSK